MTGPSITRVRMKCPFCSVSLKGSTDMWGPVYVCEGCGYATDDEAMAALLDATARRMAGVMAFHPYDAIGVTRYGI